MIKPKDFSDKNEFPGVTGNLFDIVLHKSMVLERIPNFVFIILLIIIALLAYPIQREIGLVLVIFFVFDWVSISLLPHYKRSFGPDKPPVVALAFLRIIPVFFFSNMIWLPLQILGCGLQIYAFWIEPNQIKISNQRMSTDKIKSGVYFRILHLGDLHLERLSIREERLNALIPKIAPDLILFSGDFLSLSSGQDREAWIDLREVLNEWQAPMGVYGVTGSPAVDLPEIFPALIEETPLHLLEDENVIVEKEGEKICVTGLSCTHKPHVDFPRLTKIDHKCENNFLILLHHSPDIAPMISELKYDLQLSGHTHGGQVCLPLLGPIFTGSLYGLKFKSGLYHLGNMKLYITRGLGLEGLSAPRARFLCPPEVVIWEISGTRKQDDFS